MTKSLVDSDYLKQAAEIFQPIKQRSFELMNIEPSHKVLDVGCGNGDDLVALQGYKPGVDAIGVDADLDMVRGFNLKHSEVDYPAALHKNVEDWNFSDCVFDSVRAERVFMHLDDPAKALDEMVRVTKPGGRVVVVETDWTSLTIATSQKLNERIISDCRVDGFLKNGAIGRDLYGMFKRRLAGVNVEIVPLITHSLKHFDALSLQQQIEYKVANKGLLCGFDLSMWREELNRIDQAGEFFASVNILTVSGTKKEEAKC